MFSLPETTAKASFSKVASSGGGVTTITKTGTTGTVHVLDWMVASFNETPTAAAALTVTIGGTVVFNVDISTAGPHSFTFPGGMYGVLGNALIVSMAVGGGSEVGKISARFR